jgi:hypothetical protein
MSFFHSLGGQIDALKDKGKTEGKKVQNRIYFDICINVLSQHISYQTYNLS